MVIKKVSKELCTERTNNLMDKLNSMDKKIDKFMTNHIPHLQIDNEEIRKDINRLNIKIIKIEDYIKNMENSKKKSFNWMTFIVPFITGLVFSISTIVLKMLKIIWFKMLK